MEVEQFRLKGHQTKRKTSELRTHTKQMYKLI